MSPFQRLTFSASVTFSASTFSASWNKIAGTTGVTVDNANFQTATGWEHGSACRRGNPGHLGQTEVGAQMICKAIKAGLLSAFLMCFIKCAIADSNDAWPVQDWDVCPVSKLVVSARVVGVVDEENVNAAMFKITHVYAGTSSAVDVAFLVTTTAEGKLGIDGLCHAGAFKAGEEVIWVLRYAQELNEEHPSRLLATEDLRPIVDLPARKGSSPRYDTVAAWAESVEHVWHLPMTKRLPYLLKMAHSTTPELACWALQVTSSCRMPKADELWKQLLADPACPLEVSITADELLLRADRRNWLVSAQRRHLFDRVVTGRVRSITEERYAMDMLERAFDVRELPVEQMSRLVLTAAVNPKWREQTQDSAMCLIIKELRNADEIDQQRICLALLKSIQTSPNPAERQTAARALAVTPLSERNTVFIGSVVPMITDKAAAMIIRDGLSRSLKK